jgi:hypothetical protein
MSDKIDYIRNKLKVIYHEIVSRSDGPGTYTALHEQLEASVPKDDLEGLVHVIDTIIVLVAEHGDAYDEEYHEASLKHIDDMLEE